MSFVFPRNARAYFRSVAEARPGAPRFDSMFDEYYLCLMIGLDARRVTGEEDMEDDKFYDSYPKEFQGQADIIAGLLIDAELDRQGISADDRASIEREMVRLLDHRSPVNLSADGIRLLNQYAAAGFKMIRDRVIAPHSLEDFLIAYHDLWVTESVEV
ncbi:hypothetical protein [Longimicrobium sp.]|uniref:hypothetical protein n=1 Tax=Longimicrobium sp. TaxID=2029185 RepID=UPI002E307A16|nr:hypothetical protein [Longimicrobium sp.]HEX6037784.1 hypothetical protein [Longimicrobium sp.]